MNRKYKALLATYLLLISYLMGCKNKVNSTNQLDNISYNLSSGITRYLDEETLTEEINKLNIINNKMYRENVYKVITFGDTNGYYRVMIINVYINNDDSYLIKDAFSKTDLFITYDFSEIYALNPLFENSNILYFGSLDKLSDIARINGLDKVEYNDSLSDLDVARMYISVVNDGNRVNYDDLCKVKTIG